MMSDEHGVPEGATGAQGAEEPADGVSRNGYSALAGGADNASWVTGSAAGDSSAAPDDNGVGVGEPQYPAWHSSTSSWEYASDEAEIGPSDPGKPPEPAETPEDELGDPDEAAGEPKRQMSAWRELPILIVVALAIALLIKTFVVQPFYIPSSSMEDTLMIGDKVLVNKLVYHFRSIQPGDIIVFNGDGSWNSNPPAAKPSSDVVVRAYDDTLGRLFHSIGGLFGTPVGQTDYIKRVIGTPGDHVMCCNARGQVTVNGVALEEGSYLYPGAAPSVIKFNVVVPPGRLWVMGDNRAVSDDSRLRMSDPGDGTIPENQVIGRAFVVVWPPSHWRILPIPSTFNQPGIDSNGAALTRAGATGEGSDLLGARVAPEPSYLPLAAGVVAAVPLTWLQRLTRRKVAGRLRRRRRPRHS